MVGKTLGKHTQHAAGSAFTTNLYRSNSKDQSENWANCTNEEKTGQTSNALCVRGWGGCEIKEGNQASGSRIHEAYIFLLKDI